MKLFDHRRKPAETRISFTAGLAVRCAVREDWANLDDGPASGCRICRIVGDE